jgi:DNA-binding SARP family transcriptional activator/tetratricopeptide (TPR) repeat protein
MTARTAVGSLSISLLGQARFARNGVPFRFTAPPKALPLLAYLLLHRSGPTARDSIAFLLWPDEPEEAARANLRRHLYHLQRSLPPNADRPWILADGDMLQWNPSADADVDVARFEQLRDAGELEQAVDAYGGDLLEGVYDDWVVPERERLRAALMAALDDLVRKYRSRRDFGMAARFVGRLLEADPWREDAVRQLMSVRYEAGDRAGALQVFDHFKRALRAEMDVEPMPETLALRDAVLRQLPLADVAGAAIMSDETRPFDALPMVGREHEVEQLRSLWHRAARGHGSVVFIGGEAGIGKSRLAAELALVAETEGGRVLFGSTGSPEGAPYQAVAQAFRQAVALLGAARLDPIWLAAVSAIVPELRAVNADLPALPAAEPGRERQRLFEGLAACALALSAVRPVLIELEDLHWAGEATIAALEALARRVEHAAILIVVTHRDDELDRAHPLRRLRRQLVLDKRATVVAPRRLGQEAVAQLLAAVPELAPRSDELATAVARNTEGVPLFVAQVVRQALDAARAGTPLEAASLSLLAHEGLRHAVRGSVDALSPKARALAEIAAVAGDGFDVDVVRDVGGWNEAELFETLEELLGRGLVRDVAGRGRFSYAFTHDLVREAIYAEMSAASRVLRHRRMGDALEALYGDAIGERSGDLARHFDIGGEPARATRHYLAAADHALAVHAHEETLALTSRGLELATDPRLRASMWLLREQAHARRGEPTGQQIDLDELERAAETLDDDELRREALARRIALARTLGDRDLESQLIDRLEAQVRGGAGVEWQARAALSRALYAAAVGRADARDHGLAALTLAVQREDAQAHVECLCLLATIETLAGSLDEAQRYLERARSVAEARANPALVAKALWAASGTAMMRQQFDRCAELCATCVEVSRGMGDLEGEADALARAGSALARLNSYEEAQRATAQAARLFEAIGKRQGIAMASVNMGNVATRLGALDDAEAAYVRAQRIFEELHDVRGEIVAALNLSFMHLCHGDARNAKTLAARAHELARAAKYAAFEAQALANLGAAERDAGELDAAIEHMQAGLAIAKALHRPSDLLTDLADLALAYVLKGELAAAQQIVAEITAAGDDVAESALWPQYHNWVAARVCRLAGDDERTASFLDRARGIVEKATAAMANADARERFLALPVNRDIAQAYELGQWPDHAATPARPRSGRQAGTRSRRKRLS